MQVIYNGGDEHMRHIILMPFFHDDLLRSFHDKYHATVIARIEVAWKEKHKMHPDLPKHFHLRIGNRDKIYLSKNTLNMINLHQSEVLPDPYYTWPSSMYTELYIEPVDGPSK